MFNILSTLVVASLISILCVVCFCVCANLHAKTVVHTSYDSIIRKFKPPNVPPNDLLRYRAIPNRRLVRAFSLTNTFVSADPRVHINFVGHAKRLIRAAERRGWYHFQQTVIQAVDAALPRNGSCSDFDIFVQDVVLRVALVGLLEVDVNVSEFDSDDIHTVAALITKLWSLSKQDIPIPGDLLPKLNQHLYRLVPDRETYPNPLDYVIPVWETLWRVVATAIAHTHNDDIFCNAFAALHRTPEATQFSEVIGGEFSIRGIISETLRLHPPSRHIVRARFVNPLHSILPDVFFPKNSLPFRSFGYFLHEIADIQAVLRSNVWGINAGQFLPLRHHPSRVQRDQEVTIPLVFGHGRHQCVAASWAPLAAGVIVAGILNRLGEGQAHKIVAGDRIGGRDGWKGWFIVN